MFRSPLKTVLALAALLSMAACSGNGSGPPGAEQAAKTFHAALQDDDLAGACSLLAPATLEAMEQAENGEARSCPDKLAAVSLPQAGKVIASQAYGRNAQVRYEEDTLFLTLSGGAWKVTAAGCTERGDRPYSCLVEGD